MEHLILGAILQDRDAYEYLKDEMSQKDFSPEGAVVFDLCKEFYEKDPNATKCDSGILLQRAARVLPSAKVYQVVETTLKQLFASDISAINVGQEVIAVKQGILGNKIAAKLASGRQDSSVKEMMHEYLKLADKVDLGEGSESDEFIGTSAQDLTAKSFSKEGLIPLYPLVLNEQIDGGLRGGHHVLVFAPTEMGKTLFVINACYGFLKHGLKVLYCGNEDPAPDILMRMMSRLTGRSKYDIIADPLGTDAILHKRNWANFMLISLAPGTFPRIRTLIEKHKADIVILDQLRNLDVQVDNRTQALERAATEARNLAKKYNIPVISVTQAADSASGKLRLNRGDVDGSNVGIPATIDLMLGIGATEEMEDRNLRNISIVKNKLSGQHTPITITINPVLSTVIE